MKYLCPGYFNLQKMDARPKTEMETVMNECWTHLKVFYQSDKVVMDAGLELTTKTLCRVNGAVCITDSRLFCGHQGNGWKRVCDRGERLGGSNQCSLAASFTTRGRRGDT